MRSESMGGYGLAFEACGHSEQDMSRIVASTNRSKKKMCLKELRNAIQAHSCLGILHSLVSAKFFFPRKSLSQMPTFQDAALSPP